MPSDNSHVCPWWLIWTFDNPVRRLFQNPAQILGGLVSPGQTAVDIGCGIGYYTIPLARLVGEKGQVVAVDLQKEMLAGVRQRAQTVGLEPRIRLHQCQPQTLALTTPADFVLAHWMVHEVPDADRFLREVRALLKPTGRFLLVEPQLHVSATKFQAELDLARQAGLTLSASPAIGLSRAALLKPTEA